MPAVRSSLLEPVWIQFAALLEQPEFAAGHSWGCHRRRIADRIVFEHVVAARVHGSGYERIASPGGLAVAGIGRRWGLASRARFTRVFRQRYSRTPGEIRPRRVSRQLG